MVKPETRLQRAERLMQNFMFVLLFAKVSDGDAAAIAVWIKRQLEDRPQGEVQNA